MKSSKPLISFPLHFAIYIEEDVPFSDLEPYQDTLHSDQTVPPNGQ